MKILVITLTVSEKCGLGRYSLDLIGELAKENELIIFTAKRDKELNLFFPNSKIFYIFPGEDKIYRIMRPWLFFKYLVMILPQARRADLIHSFMDFPYSFLASVLGLVTRKPVISTAHGTYSIVPFLDKRWSSLARWTFRHLDKIICVSNFTKKEILKKVSDAGCEVINNGVSLNNFVNDAMDGEVGQPRLQGEDSKILLSVGMLKYRKGYHVSIPAVALVKEKYPDLKYCIVGRQNDKGYFEKLKRMVEEYNLEDNVVFLEDISDDELTKLYKQADLFLLTPVYDRGNFEGFGLVYLEAGIYGKPVVGSRGSGSEDAVIHNKTGLLAAQNDVEATAEAVLKILDSQELAWEFGKNGQEFARRQSWDRVVLKYQAVYREII